MIYDYKNTVNKEYWTNYLGRELTRNEHILLCNTKSEKLINLKINSINEIAKKSGLCVSMLTNMHGNCIFESLQYFNMCDDIDQLRKGLALIMLAFKNKKNFIPNQELSLGELFGFYNDVEYVFCKSKQKLYKYNFDAMCIDLATDCSWTRLNTELIFTIMSIVLNLKFMIFHDNGHITTICTEENVCTKTIYMGLIDEVHYFPLDKISEGTPQTCPNYKHSLKLFHKWARHMSDKLGRTISDSSDETETEDSADVSNE
jgi:hypothetical protein